VDEEELDEEEEEEAEELLSWPRPNLLRIPDIAREKEGGESVECPSREREREKKEE